MNRNLNFLQPRLFWNLLILSIIFLGCERQPTIRQYTEIFIDAEKKSSPRTEMFSKMPQDDIHAGLMPEGANHATEMQQQLTASVDQTALLWETPKEWVEKKGSGLRLATFNGTNPKAMVETSIVSLGGQAGGVEANVTRWIQQLGLNVPDTQKLNDFINQQEHFSTSSSLPITVIDLTQLQDKNPANSPSMVAAIIDKKDTQIFIKMTGEKQAVLQNRDTFKKFIKSIRLK